MLLKLLPVVTAAALIVQCGARDQTVVAGSLADHRAAFTSGICSGLHQAYTDLHKQIIEGQKAQRFLVFVSPPSGTADRLLGLVSAFLVALLTQRALLIAPHPMPYEALYDQPFINWTTSALSLRVMMPVKWPAGYRICSKCRPGPPNLRMNCDVCEDDGHSVAYMNWIGIKDARLWHVNSNFHDVWPDVHTVYYTGNRGISVGMFHNLHHQRTLHAMGLRPSTAFGCIYNYLLFPKPETLEVVQVEMRELLAADLVIGIQIRTDDKYMGPGHSLSLEDVEAYRKNFECAQNLEEVLRVGQLHVKWFVVSDSVTIRTQAQMWYGNKIVVYMRSKPTHLSDSATVDMLGSRLAAAEHWLFGMTDYQVITWWSGYGRTAAMRALRDSTVQAITDETVAGNCTPATMQSPWELGHAYSGARRVLYTDSVGKYDRVTGHFGYPSAHVR